MVLIASFEAPFLKIHEDLKPIDTHNWKTRSFNYTLPYKNEKSTSRLRGALLELRQTVQPFVTYSCRHRLFLEALETMYSQVQVEYGKGQKRKPRKTIEGKKRRRIIQVVTDKNLSLLSADWIACCGWNAPEMVSES
ncbi:hypothetical protein C0J52_27665 [Blattella germanica]|nr:hypothetical protein C0J52_27665 [Blattella germanica]